MASKNVKFYAGINECGEGYNHETEFPIYEILRDLIGSEQYEFEVGDEGLSESIGDGRWRQIGTATAPAGSKLATADCGDVMLYLPDHPCGIPAHEVVRGAGHWASGVGYRTSKRG